MEQIEINGLLWDTENLEVDIKCDFKQYSAIGTVQFSKEHFTWDEAMQVGTCVGKRPPTLKEYECLLTLGWRWSETDKGIWLANGKLFFPAAGRRYYSTDTLGGSGTDGYMWTYTPNGMSAYYLYFNPWDAEILSFDRSYCFSVRCVQEIITPFITLL